MVTAEYETIAHSLPVLLVSPRVNLRGVAISRTPLSLPASGMVRRGGVGLLLHSLLRQEGAAIRCPTRPCSLQSFPIMRCKGRLTTTQSV